MEQKDWVGTEVLALRNIRVGGLEDFITFQQESCMNMRVRLQEQELDYCNRRNRRVGSMVLRVLIIVTEELG